MRPNLALFSLWAAVSLVLGSGIRQDDRLQRRQDGTQSSLPTSGSSNIRSASATASADSTNTNTQTANGLSSSVFTPAQQSTPATNSAATISLATAATTSNILSTSTASAAQSSATATGRGNGTTSSSDSDENSLPLEPLITPAFAIAGVVLILTGVVHALIGVKNKWVHTFLSTAYLTSLSITVLIVYVLNPPISNAIQGAYFVGIIMTGIIFGAGSLVFKEVTEGLGCLLGGFCVSMWFLTLKEGGLINSRGGKAVFIAAFSIVAWSLSFSHYTRAYGLMFSIAFSGATAFVLGIDCFSRGGLKEFWVYLWDLNDNIFPLNTNTYPISRGTRVETIVIVLATIIGIVSQIKLWKIVKDRQKKRDEEQEEESRRREAVEAALGRHLQRQNDRDRSQWEKQYGDRLTAKRETILWTDAHGEKGYSKIRESELHENPNSSSTESLEMSNLSKKSRSMYVTRVQRNSVPVTSILEVEEGDRTARKAEERQKVLDQLEGNASSSEPRHSSSPHTTTNIATRPGTARDSDNMADVSGAASTIGELSENSSIPSRRRSVVLDEATDDVEKPQEKRNSDLQNYLAAPVKDSDKKRRSFTSILSRSKEKDNRYSASQSQEALVIPEAALHHSRASSLAATLDFENENLELPPIDVEVPDQSRTPHIVISPVEAISKPGTIQTHSIIREIAPSEPELAEEHFDLDPEEFVRPAAGNTQVVQDEGRASSGANPAMKQQSGSESASDTILNEVPQAKSSVGGTTEGEAVLTKDVLEQMPSHLSHVVMSYRTNEWAKHISTADAPLVEEPESIQAPEDAEPSTHLADPNTPIESKRSSLSQPPPLEVPPPVPSAMPSRSEGIRINPALQYEQAPISMVVEPVQPIARVRSTSESKQIPRGFRSTSTPMLVKQTQQHPTILENAVVEHVPRQTASRSASLQSIRGYDASGVAAGALQQGVPHNYPVFDKSRSRLSLVSENGMVPARSNSQMSAYGQNYPYQQSLYQQAGIQPMPSRSDTRLQFYDSHQPLRRNESIESQRREAMLTDWRVSQNRPAPDQQLPTDIHRRQMLMERQQIKMTEEQEKNFKARQELATDARMRGRDMQELHREAMRKMQASVNKNISH